MEGEEEDGEEVVEAVEVAGRRRRRMWAGEEVTLGPLEGVGRGGLEAVGSGGCRG